MSSEYRKVSVKLAKNKRYKSVDPVAKLLYHHLLTNPQSNSAGCYEIPFDDICHDLRLPDTSIHTAIKDLSIAQLIEWDEENEVLLIERALKHWPITNTKHGQGAIKRLLDLPDCFLKSKRMKELAKEKKLTKEQKALLGAEVQRMGVFDSPIEGVSLSRPRPRPRSIPKPKPKSRPKVNKSSDELSLAAPKTSSLVWEAYSFAYQRRYNIEPVRNAKVNAQIAQFVKRIPANDAPFVAACYVSSNNSYYISRGHSVACLLADAEKLRTEAITGEFTTSKGAYEVDSLSQRRSRYLKIIEKYEEEDRVQA